MEELAAMLELDWRHLQALLHDTDRHLHSKLGIVTVERLPSFSLAQCSILVWLCHQTSALRTQEKDALVFS